MRFSRVVLAMGLLTGIAFFLASVRTGEPIHVLGAATVAALSVIAHDAIEAVDGGA